MLQLFLDLISGLNSPNHQAVFGYCWPVDFLRLILRSCATCARALVMVKWFFRVVWHQCSLVSPPRYATIEPLEFGWQCCATSKRRSSMCDSVREEMKKRLAALREHRVLNRIETDQVIFIGSCSVLSYSAGLVSWTLAAQPALRENRVLNRIEKEQVIFIGGCSVCSVV